MINVDDFAKHIETLTLSIIYEMRRDNKIAVTEELYDFAKYLKELRNELLDEIDRPIDETPTEK